MKIFFWIIEYIASFTEIAMCCVFCGIFLTNLTEEKSGGRKYLILAGSAVSALLIIVLNKIDIFSLFNSIIVFLMAFLLQMFIYRKRAGLCVALMLIYDVILAAFDFAIAYFTAFMIHVDVNYLLNHQSFSRVLCILLSKSLLVLTVATMSKLLRKSITFMKKYVAVMFAYSAFLLVSLFVMVGLNINNRNPKTELFLMVFFIISIVIELMVFYFVIKVGESYEQQQKTELIETKNRMLQKSLDETEQAFKLWRRSVHNYKNSIIALRQLAVDGDIEGIKEYLNRESKLIDKKMFYIKTGSSVVDTIVNTNFDEIKQILKHNPNIKVYKDKIIVYEDNTECNIQAEKLKNQEVYVYLEGAKYETLQGETGSNTLNTHITVTTKNRTSDLQLFVGKHEYYQGAVDGVLNLGISNTDKKEMAIRFTKAGTYYFKNIQVASASMKGYTKKVQKLKEDKIEGFKIAGSDVSLNVNVDKNKVLCIAIPYAQGWSVKVNGKDAKLLNCNLMYMGVELEAGNNQVELHYEMPGFKLGVLCSGIFGCVFLLYIILLGIRKVKNRKNVVCA